MTDTLAWLKLSIWIGIIVFLGLSFLLWINTPELFEYFNMAFCAH